MNTTDFENVIIKALFANETVKNKVLPELQSSWFFDFDNKQIIEKIIDFNTKFGKMPNVLETRRMLSDETVLSAFDSCMMIKDEEVNTEFIIEEIEEFVRRKLLYNTSEEIVKYCKTGTSSGSFSDKISDAEGFSFDTNIGFSFFEDPRRLYEDANVHEKIYHTGLKTIDDLIGGGFHEKSLNLILASTNIGKTLIMCSLATNLIMSGYNVLYVTFEDNENKIASRIAQNMFDVTQEQYKKMSLEEFGKAYKNAMTKLKDNKLIIKEFPEGSSSALTIKTLMKELKEKKNFIPDVLFIDYIGCMVPNGRQNPNMNTNTILMLVAAQVRSIGMELGIPVISASQTNRGGYGMSEINLDDVSDSFSSTMKADAIFGFTQSEEFKEQGLYSVKLLKTRYGNKRGTITSIGVNVEKQRIFDVTNYSGNQTVNIFDSTDDDKKDSGIEIDFT